MTNATIIPKTMLKTLGGWNMECCHGNDSHRENEHKSTNDV